MNSLRNAVILIFAILILLGIGDKYLEYSTLKSISDQLSSTERQEISLVEESSKLSEKAFDLLSKILTNEKSSNEEKLKQFKELEGLINQALNNQGNYIQTLEANREKYKTLSFRTNLLLGRRGDIAKQLLSNQESFYNNEINVAKDSYIGNTAFAQLITIFKDSLVLTDYDAKATKSGETYFSQHFTDIASLEKYTRGDFRFKEDEQIKNLYPYGYESLHKYKDYFASYYAVVKDFIAGDLESASYKYSRIQETAANLNIDWDKLTTEGDERQKDRAKNIISSVTNEVKMIKDFKENKLGSYPGLPAIDKWKEDLVLCQLYFYKAGFYNFITSKYPDSSNFEDLLVQLSEVSPKTDVVDNKFDKSVVKFTNSDKEIKFECTDKEDGRVFVFKTSK